MAALPPDLEFHIRGNTPWNNLPASVKEILSDNRKIYEKEVCKYSVANQFVWRTSLVRHIIKNERKYYEEVLKHSRDNLMLYPYHLQDQFVQGLKMPPFDYYHSMLQLIMVEQKSYDSLPNFTARDCLRLTSIGRNQYIDTMNKYRSKRFWKKQQPSEFIPSNPPHDLSIQPWWFLNVGYVTEEEAENCTPEERTTIDHIITEGIQMIGSINQTVVRNLYTRKLVYIIIPISDDDHIVIPPLKGFVMNRVQGDYFENLLYKVFVTNNEQVNVTELTSVLQIPLQEVKNALSVFIRLGFAHKKMLPDPSTYHKSWMGTNFVVTPPPNDPLDNGKELVMEDFMLVDVTADTCTTEDKSVDTETTDAKHLIDVSGFQRRIGFLFDSTLTAFLMMGNLSPSLKNHAVTMFEVGKLTDEAMDSFIMELDKVEGEPEGEGEAQRYFHHAVILRNTVRFLRNNSQLMVSEEEGILGLDLLHFESITKLDRGTLSRLLQKNYSILISMAPISQEVETITNCIPPHIGPAIPEMNSIWFKFWLYSKVKCGPPSLLLTRGTRLTTLPHMFRHYDKLLISSWGHDHAIIATTNVLLSLNEALTHSSVLIQAYSWCSNGKLEYVTFPFERTGIAEDNLMNHAALKKLEQYVDLKHTCGYVTMLYTGIPNKEQTVPKTTTVKDAGLQAKQEEISEFLEDLKELGIGSGNGAGQPLKETMKGDVPHNEPANEEETESPIIQKLSSLWVPLELCFGIPLFNDETNRIICQKIVSNKLFNTTNLQNLKHAYRLLSIELMDFISNYQEIDAYSHKSVKTSDDSVVPLPTQNLLFDGGVLKPFVL